MLEQDFIHITEILERMRHSHRQSLSGTQDLSILSVRQFYYLKVIKQLGYPTLTDLARSFLVTKPSVTVIINKLCVLGFIEKHQSTTDRRVSNVRLTPKGHRMVQVETDAMVEFCSQVRSFLSENEIEELEFLLAKIIVKIS
jgi:DNA-binding MarR family transcriptional regulator